MPNFDLANLALKAVCPNNEILYDDKGLPSIMVKIPKMTYAQLGLGDSQAIHPAFIVNGQEVDAIYISKYQNIVVDGRAYSLPGEDPKTSINFDGARAACEAKGAGWHLMTRAEWALLALWCKLNGTQPYGNNNYGKDHHETNYKAIPTSKDGNNTGRVATGTGPVSWSHDGTVSGIWDLNGNCWEWVGGLRTVYGELQILANNNAADAGNSQAAGSAQWMAISGADGSLITPNGSGTTPGSVKMDWANGKLTYSTSITDASRGAHDCDFEAVTFDDTIGENAQACLKALALLKDDSTSGAYQGDHVYFNNNEAERAFDCGGDWDDAAGNGVFALNGTHPRPAANGHISFRSAYVELPTA